MDSLPPQNACRLSLLSLLRERRRPARPVDEVRLRHEAARAFPEVDYAALTKDALARISQDRGVDFATALFYDRVRRSPEHGAFLAALEALTPDIEVLPRLSGKVLVAPGLFHDRAAETGGDGALVRRIASGFGLATGVIPVPGDGSLATNAAVIRRALDAEPDGSVILVSLSKGGADVRVALAEGGPTLRKVRAWLQICGLVRGTPLLDAFVHAPPWERALLRGLLAPRRIPARLIRDMAHAPQTLAALPAATPAGVLVINLLACPLACHLSRTLRARHAWMAPLGPNDGYSLLRDAILEPGLVLPVWGADHFLRVPEASRLLYQVFLYLGALGAGG